MIFAGGDENEKKKTKREIDYLQSLTKLDVTLLHENLISWFYNYAKDPFPQTKEDVIYIMELHYSSLGQVGNINHISISEHINKGETDFTCEGRHFKVISKQK